jgi:protein-tyrosine phosphatase
MTVEQIPRRRDWWIDKASLRATGNPTNEELATLRADGFRAIVSLLDDSEPANYDAARAAEAGWILHRFPIPDGGSPSVEQMDDFVLIIRTLSPNAKAIVHCQTGGSRSGVMAAAYWIDRGVSVREAIARVCASNPDITITPERQEALERFAAARGQLEPIERLVFEADRLMATHPPVWESANKRVVYGIACRPGTMHRGRLLYSRWDSMAPPRHVDLAAAERLETRADIYDYAPTSADAVEWHVNFADPDLFGFYGSDLFAQDEMQVAEHPALGALREALAARGSVAKTKENGRPTPVLVMGAERRCRIATDPSPENGPPNGLYGNAFARATPDAVQRATTPIDPPTITNIIAMAAPRGGPGRYDEGTISEILTTAYTGFRAAVLESARHHGDGRPVVVHTGFWGCGAFGGNRVLMSLLQAIAAEMAEVERVVFHAVNRAGEEHVKAAKAFISDELADETAAETRAVIARIVTHGFAWGISDGN